MKKINIFKYVAIAVIAVTISSMSASAQTGQKAVGGNLIIGTGRDYTHVGIGGKFFYNVTDPIRLAGEFDFFPKNDEMTWWDFSAYGHYLFPVADNISIFPQAGLGFVGTSWKYTDVDWITGKKTTVKESDSEFVLSIGGGVDIEITSNLVFQGELRFKFLDGMTRTNIVAGIAYKF